MSLTRHQGGGVIALSFLGAFALAILPLPGAMEIYRPEWVTLTLIYWAMALPARVGVAIGWFAGLLLDVLRDTLLGQYALALALVAFLTLHLHQRLRVFPLWQQGLSVFVLVMLQGLVVIWIKGLIGQSPGLWAVIAPALTSGLVWPAVYLYLRHLRRRHQVA